MNKFEWFHRIPLQPKNFIHFFNAAFMVCFGVRLPSPINPQINKFYFNSALPLDCCIRRYIFSFINQWNPWIKSIFWVDEWDGIDVEWLTAGFVEISFQSPPWMVMNFHLTQLNHQFSSHSSLIVKLKEWMICLLIHELSWLIELKES